MKRHHQSRRKVAVFGAAASAALLPMTAATASPLNQQAREVVPFASHSVTLTVLRSYSSGETALYAKYSKDFPRLHPGAQLKWIRPETGSTLAKFETMDAAGDPPNVYMAENANAAILMQRDALSPVDYKALGVKGLAQLRKEYVSPESLNQYINKGVLYGIPQQLSNYNTYVNAKEFSAAHVPIPSSWNQVCADGNKLLIKKGGVVKQEELALPIDFPAAEILVADAVAAEYGQPLFNQAGTKSYLTSPKVIKAFTMLQNLVYKCNAFVPSVNGTTTAAERELFGEGRSAMVMDVGVWYTPVMTGSYPKVWKDTKVVPYPSGSTGVHVSPGYSYAYVVARSAPDQTLSWQLVKYMKDTGNLELSMSGTFSGLKSVAAPSPITRKIPFWNKVWVPTLAQAQFLPALANSTEIAQDIGNAYDSILLDHANVASALKGASSAIAPLLNH